MLQALLLDSSCTYGKTKLQQHQPLYRALTLSKEFRYSIQLPILPPFSASDSTAALHIAHWPYITSTLISAKKMNAPKKIKMLFLFMLKTDNKAKSLSKQLPRLLLHTAKPDMKTERFSCVFQLYYLVRNRTK